jgi:hypothetical protein
MFGKICGREKRREEGERRGQRFPLSETDFIAVLPTGIFPFSIIFNPTVFL